MHNFFIFKKSAHGVSKTLLHKNVVMETEAVSQGSVCKIGQKNCPKTLFPLNSSFLPNSS
ncbi:MAG: hypothetical protein LBE12_15610 [Planctomycetaceae bacterium]|nr:hypothetical protein [Planctomycetaceae bacterium]